MGMVAFAPVANEWEQDAPRETEFAQVSHVDPPHTGMMPTRSAFSFAGRRVEFSENDVVLSVFHCPATSFASIAPYGACVEQIDNGLSQGQQSFWVLRLTV